LNRSQRDPLTTLRASLRLSALTHHHSNTALRKVTHMDACKVVELGDVKTETHCGTAVNQYDCYPQKWR
jgi:hypothetical protein